MTLSHIFSKIEQDVPTQNGHSNGTADSEALGP